MEAIKREIYLQACLADISKGNRIRISISGGSWPAIGVNSGNKKHIPGAVNQHCLITTISFELKTAKLEICPLLAK